MKSRRLLLPLMLLALVVSPLLTFANEKDEELYKYYDLFVRVLSEIQEKYYGDPPDLDKLFYGALEGMTSGLDIYSHFEPPDVHAQVEIDTTGKFGGLGMEITIDIPTKYIKVVTPIEGTPAFRAGVRPDDLIVKIEGESTRGMSSGRAASQMRGPRGTQVTISILHKGESKPVDMTITRAVVELESIKGFERDPDGGWKFMLDPDAGIGYVRVTQFQATTAKELKDMVEELLDQGMKALVLDLRFNPGGLFSAAIQMSDLFLSGEKIVTIKGKLAEESKDFMARKAGTFPEFPLAVLVNQFSASASEIVAGALHDNKRAIIVGERTFGKGKVQTLVPLESGRSAIRLTTAEYLTPSGKSIARPTEATEEEGDWGIEPDISVKLSDDKLTELLDHRGGLHILQNPSPSPSPGPSQEEEVEKKPFVDLQLETAVSAVKGALLYRNTLDIP